MTDDRLSDESIEALGEHESVETLHDSTSANARVSHISVETLIQVVRPAPEGENERQENVEGSPRQDEK